MKEIKKSIVLFAGTTEGKLLAEYLQELSQPFVICMAARYARDLLEGICRPDQAGCMEMHQGRLDVTKMEQMSDELRPGLVIGATHLYTVEVARNIRIAYSGRRGLRLIEYLREPGIGDGRPGVGVVHMPGAEVVRTPDMETVVTWLPSMTGNILVTTGNKELSSCTRIKDYEQRTYARVLPSEGTVAWCRSLGFEGRHTIAMQGPFSKEINLTQLREYGYACLVTKDNGAARGFSERIKTTRRAGAAAVVIDRPGSGEGISSDEMKGQLKERMDHKKEGSIHG